MKKYRNINLDIKLLSFFVALFVAVIFAFWWLNKDNKVELSVSKRIDLTPTRIQKIQEIGQWEFLSITDEELVDTVKHGFFGDSELVRIYHGTLRLGVDLHKAGAGWLRVEGDSVVVAKLPTIELLDKNFIDEARSRSFFEKGTWKEADREALYKKAYRKMLARCFTKANIQAAEENAKRQFGQFLQSMGYKRNRVEFSHSAPK